MLVCLSESLSVSLKSECPHLSSVCLLDCCLNYLVSCLKLFMALQEEKLGRPPTNEETNVEIANVRAAKKQRTTTSGISFVLRVR